MMGQPWSLTNLASPSHQERQGLDQRPDMELVDEEVEKYKERKRENGGGGGG